MRKPRLLGLLTACLMLPAFASAQTYSISGITPLDFSKNSSYQVTTGGGAQLFQPVLKFASSTGTVGTITRNPACSDNITLQHSGSSEPNQWGDPIDDYNVAVEYNSNGTATLKPTVKSLVWGSSRYIIVDIPQNYFRADNGATFPAAETKYVYSSKATTYTSVQTTLPTASDKRLRFKMSGGSNPQAIQFAVVITNTASNESTTIKTFTVEGNDVVVDMSGFKSGNYTYRFSDGSVYWTSASGGVYINDEATGSINNFQGASYFDTFTMEMTNRKLDQYGMITNVPVGQVYDVANKRPINMGQYTLIAPAGTPLAMGSGQAELLYHNGTGYVSFDEPIVWNAATELSPMRFFVTLKKNGASADDNVVLRNIVLDENDMPTVVEGLGMDVLMPDTYYDLNGRRVVNPEKGIFILNGKKVVVK